MKKLPVSILGLFLSAVCMNTTFAQATAAKSVAKKVVNQVQGQQQVGPVRPGPAPAGAAAVQQPPADPAAIAAGKAEVEKKRLEYQLKKAEEGSPIAQYDLAIRYLTGNGVEKNETTAKAWLEKSAKNGNTAATKKLVELNKAKK